MKKGRHAGGASSGLRQRQVKGRKHMRRVDIYFSPDEKQVVEMAAQRSGLSVSFYGAQAILRAAMVDMGGPRTLDLNTPLK